MSWSDNVPFARQLSLQHVNGATGTNHFEDTFRKVGPFTNTTMLLVNPLGRGSIGDLSLKCIQEQKSMLFLCEYIVSWSVSGAKEVYISDEELKLNTYYQRVVLVLSKSLHESIEITEPDSIKRGQHLNG